MKTVYKIILDHTNVQKPQSYDFYQDAHILCVQVQDGYITIWALCDTAKPKEKYTFQIYFTGWPCDADTNTDMYIGTVQNCGLVHHIFRKNAFIDH